MANFSRIEVANVMKQTGLVPLFYNADVEISKQVVKAVYDGGARLLEFTSRGDFAHEVFGTFRRGGFSSTTKFIDHFMETIKIRLHNKQNKLIVLMVFILKYLKNLKKL